MLRRNIPGAIFICVILFSFIGIGISMGISLNWSAYFKYIAIVAVVAFIISAIINTVPDGNKDN